MRLLRPLNVSTQLLLLLPQGCLFLATNRAAGKNHHERLVARLLAIRRAAGRGLRLLAFERAILLATLATLLDRRHALRIVRLGFLARPENVILGYEGLCEVPVTGGEKRFLLRLKRGKFALRGAAAPSFNGLACRFNAEIIE